MTRQVELPPGAAFALVLEDNRVVILRRLSDARIAVEAPDGFLALTERALPAPQTRPLAPKE